MSGELEAAGAMATAGLVAGAIEGREPGQAGHGACLNCGAKLEGAFCSQCGQAALPRRSLLHVFEEFLHGLFHFDTKVWRTLPMVMFRPGTLTRNYVYGKRARYVSPLATFLLTIFFMFAVFAFAGGPPINVDENGSVEDAQEDLADAREELAEAQRELDEVLAHPDPDQPAGLEESLARQALGRAEGAIAREEQALRRAIAREAAASAQGAQEATAVAPAQVGATAPLAPPAPAPPPAATPQSEPGLSAQASISDGQAQAGVDIAADDGAPLTWQDASRQMADDPEFVPIEGWDTFNNRIREKLRNPELALYKVQEAASQFSFLLVPISLPFIALLFLWKRGVNFYDHVVFALYALSFVSILFVVMVLAGRSDFTFWIAPMAVSLGIPIHMFFHLKGAYALGWFSALWRTFFLLIFANIALVIFLVTILIVGLAG